MIGNKGILSNLNSIFSLLSVTLVDSFTSYTEGVGTINATPSLSISSILYISKFLSNLLPVSRLTKSLDCSLTFFRDYYVFQELRTQKTIGIGHESGGLYHIERGSEVIACFNSLPYLDILCWSGHRSSQNLKNLVSNLSHVSSLDYESCQLGKHYCMSYSLRVDKRVDGLFDFPIFGDHVLLVQNLGLGIL